MELRKIRKLERESSANNWPLINPDRVARQLVAPHTKSQSNTSNPAFLFYNTNTVDQWRPYRALRTRGRKLFPGTGPLLRSGYLGARHGHEHLPLVLSDILQRTNAKVEPQLRLLGKLYNPSSHVERSIRPVAQNFFCRACNKTRSAI